MILFACLSDKAVTDLTSAAVGVALFFAVAWVAVAWIKSGRR